MRRMEATTPLRPRLVQPGIRVPYPCLAQSSYGTQVMLEKFSNGGSAVVGAGGVDASATTLPTLYRSNLPAGAVFRVKIEAEILKVTTGGNSAANWTVERGTEGTTAAAHSEGAIIKQVLTAQALADAISTGGGGMTNPMTTSGDIIYGGSGGIATRLPKGTDAQVLTLASGVPSWSTPTGGGGASITTGPASSRPAAAGNSGNVYLPNDVPGLYRSDGTSWSQFGSGSRYTKVNPADWTWDFPSNAGHAFYLLYDQCWRFFTGEAPTVNDYLRGKKRTRVGGSDVAGNLGTGNYIVCLQPMFVPGADGMKAGIGLRVQYDVSTFGGRFVAFGVSQSSDGTAKLWLATYTDVITTNATSPNLSEFLPFSGNGPIWLRIQVTSTDKLKYYYSVDGVFWVQVMKHSGGNGEAEDLTAGYFSIPSTGTTVADAKKNLSEVLLWYSPNNSNSVTAGVKYLSYSEDQLEYAEVNYPPGEPVLI